MVPGYMRAISAAGEQRGEEPEFGAPGEADQSCSVEKEVHLLTAGLRKEHAGVAGGEVERVDALTLALRTDRVGRAPCGAGHRGAKCVFEPFGFALGDESTEASRRVRGRRTITPRLVLVHTLAHSLIDRSRRDADG